ncbi:conserved protein of unknown function BmrU [Galbibacter orientalis DSM 19592]|uniref:DAGKc domain-containing protein n=1 Tax=Galbibacter orientalis DSM 19592 TaxID=926559 RepID=I3CB27_9FLAO|nr:YegS/Rv2252/BmrU family lipid kinase [Galbibacter orientalis]EIJ40820.1 conserved protein of unknown function BmrU [Galbibacter orientalis DSM 19592]
MTHIPAILLIVNPISGDIDKDILIQKVEKQVLNEGKNLLIYKTSGKHDIQEITSILKENSPQRVLVAGGDGTIKLCVEALQKFDIPLGIIPAGSANGLAVDLGIPTDLNNAIDLALNKNAKPMDILKINGETAIHISDIGINASLVKNYDKSNIRGKLGYALQSIPTLIDFKETFRFKIVANGTIKEGHAMMIAIANSQKYGNGAVINPKGKLDDGKFEVLIFKSLQMGKILQTIFNEIPFDEDFVEMIATDVVEITTKEAIPFQIDGEYIEKTKKIEAKIFSKQAQIIY